MDVRSILRVKRDGGALSGEAIRELLGGYVAGDVPDYQMAALLMAIFHHGMERPELEAWTAAMLNSGSVLRFEGGGPYVDKHSTGGVGDKVSLPLAPALAACGVRVPMISGRGLGHTGGTLDKLEAIPGFRCDLDEPAFRRALAEAGAVIGAQTEDLVPADRKLYALRDATGVIESIPLIASSILSKKLAEGLDALVLDVKFGSGAFLPDVADGERLGQTMLALSRGMGLSASVFLTAMDRPLGETVGHALEIRETLACLRGEGPADLRTLVSRFGGELLRLAGAAESADRGSARVEAALDDGSALKAFERMVTAQGGDPRTVREPERLPSAPDEAVIEATASGSLTYTDVREIGMAVTALGGGRRAPDDKIDFAVGVELLAQAGDVLAPGAPLFRIHHRAGAGLEEARTRLARSITLGAATQLAPLVRSLDSKQDSGC